MTTVAQPTDIARTFETSNQIPISDISPSSGHTSFYILAQVALVWPYSSSTGTLSLLLADPDIRRRKSRGQVKVVFRHGCAREVARTKVGIGDTVKLALAGCVWTETGDAVSTPGKKIDWDLEYRGHVNLRVLEGGQESSAVDYTANDSDASAVNGAISLLNGTYISRPSVNGVLHRPPSTIHVPYLTPRKTPRSSSAGTFVDAAFDSSAEEDGYIPGHGRKRTKFARNSGAWSLVDEEEEPQPRPEDGPLQPCEDVDLMVDSEEHADEQQVERETVEHASTEIKSPFDTMGPPDPDVMGVSSSPPPAPAIEPPLVSVMGPPSSPFRPLRLRLSSDEVEAPQASLSSDAATTPRLHPIPSPGLPLVSPLLQRTGVEVGYFPAFDVPTSQLDASADSIARAATDNDRPPQEADVESIRSDESLLVVEQLSTRNAGENIKEGPVQPSGHFEIIDDPLTGAEKWNSMSTTGDLQSQFLSPVEPKIDQELQSDEVAFGRSSPLPQSSPEVVEIEDDDMYGAPAGGARTNGSMTSQLLVETPRSPLDVLEQFLQMSPVTAAGPSASFETGGDVNFPATPVHSLQQSFSESVSTDIRPDKISVPNTKHSPVTYPESQSPFRQNRDQQASSNDSSRRSSAHRTRMYSIDGASDEQQPFAEYINHLAHIAATAESVQLPTADILRQEVEIREGPSTAAEGPAAVTEVNEVIRAEPTTGAAEEELLQTGGSIVTNTAVMEEPLPPTIPTYAHPQDATTIHEVVPLQIAEAQLQLPTPDQSQMEHLSPELQAQPVLKQHEEAADITLPSPQHTQELVLAQEIQEEAAFETQGEAGPAIGTDEIAAQTTTELDLSQRKLDRAAGEDNEFSQATAEGGMIVQEAEGADDLRETPAQVTRKAPPQIETEEDAAAATSATPGLAPKSTESQPDTTTPLRVSQRLSARKSIMTSNISSPYFTSRKSALPPSSPPIRKENIRPSSPDRSTLPSLDIQERGKAPFASSAVEEVEQNGNEVVLLSPNKARRPISRRHTGTTTPLAYYAHLSSLDEHFGKVVDVLATCVESSSKPERAKSGPKDYLTTLRVADPSLTSDEHAAIPVQIFRPVKSALPTAIGGEVVILRNFKVQTAKRKFMLLSTDTSSWAVFKAKPDSTMSWSDVVISGPPIEYGPAETSRVKLLFSWWNSNGQQQFSPNISRHNHEDVGMSSPELRSRSPQRKENVPPISKAKPANRRRLGNETDNFNNEDAVENFFASFNNRDDGSVADGSVGEEAANTLPAKPVLGRDVNMTDGDTNEADTTKLSPRTLRQRKANRTDHLGNEGDEDTNVTDYDRGKSAPLMDATNRRRQSVVSLAASESGTTLTPRRSTRQKQRKSPSVVHELRDGTKYADDDQGKGGTVVHELRDGVTYVDE